MDRWMDEWAWRSCLGNWEKDFVFYETNLFIHFHFVLVSFPLVALLSLFLLPKSSHFLLTYKQEKCLYFLLFFLPILSKLPLSPSPSIYLQIEKPYLHKKEIPANFVTGRNFLVIHFFIFSQNTLQKIINFPQAHLSLPLFLNQAVIN